MNLMILAKVFVLFRKSSLCFQEIVLISSGNRLDDFGKSS